MGTSSPASRRMTRLTDDHPGLVKPGRGNPSDNVDVAPATPQDGEAIPGGETRTLEFWRETGPKDRRDHETQGHGSLRTACVSQIRSASRASASGVEASQVTAHLSLRSEEMSKALVPTQAPDCRALSVANSSWGGGQVKRSAHPGLLSKRHPGASQDSSGAEKASSGHP